MASAQNQSANVVLFDAYFRRDDLDRDGRIRGDEAVASFQGSGLPKQVLAQTWAHADQRQTGFLGRAEFILLNEEKQQANQQKPRVPELEKHLVNQLTTEEVNSLNSKFKAATEADKKVSKARMRNRGSGELRKKKRKKEKVAGELKGEKSLKKSAKAKDDAELNGEKVVGEKKLKRSAKAGEEDGATVNHKKDGLSLKEKKKDVTRKKADDSSAQGEESIGKKEKRKSKESVGKKEKRKSEDEKLKSTEANLKKAKRSKKAAE